MSRKIVWQSDALDDLDAALAFLSERSPAAADALEIKVNQTLVRLSLYSIGRPSRLGHGFEKLITGTFYTLVYDLADTSVSIIRIIHQRRD